MIKLAEPGAFFKHFPAHPFGSAGYGDGYLQTER